MPDAPIWNLDGELASDLASRGELQPLLDLVAAHALWVDPRVARAVPVVFPHTARLTRGRHREGDAVGGVTLWGNQPAHEAALRALGLRPRNFAGGTACHVYPHSPRSPAHFTRLANLVVLPTPLAPFAEFAPVLAAIKWRAYRLYGYRGPAQLEPRRPSLLPREWASPTPLAPDRLAHVLTKLEHARATRPAFTRAASKRKQAAAPRTRRGARDLAGEFVRDLEARPDLFAATLGWFVRHAYFAPPRVVAAIGNPLPGERAGTPAGFAAPAKSTAAARVLFVALSTRSNRVSDASVVHLYPAAADLPDHYSHLGGLALVPQALSALAATAPFRAVLQRRSFDRCGYAWPSAKVPERPPWMPNEWPENRKTSHAQEDHAIEVLRRYLRRAR